MPPPTETSILTTFLIPPSSLPEVISLQRFTDLFPKNNRTHADIPVLYRELQHQRALVVDQIKEDIRAEAKRGERSRREVVRARRRAEAEELVGISGAIQGDHGREVQMETAVGPDMSFVKLVSLANLRECRFLVGRVVSRHAIHIRWLPSWLKWRKLALMWRLKSQP